MAQKIFQLLDNQPTIVFGKGVYTAEASIEPGLLVVRTSGSTVSLCDPTDKPFGIAYGLRYSPYRPTTVAFDSGEAMVILEGRGLVLMSSDFFTSGVLPQSGDTLLTGTNGLWNPQAASGTYKVGTCLRTQPYTQFTGGTGTAQTVALVEFDITKYGTGS